MNGWTIGRSITEGTPGSQLACNAQTVTIAGSMFPSLRSWWCRYVAWRHIMAMLKDIRLTVILHYRNSLSLSFYCMIPTTPEISVAKRTMCSEVWPKNKFRLWITSGPTRQVPSGAVHRDFVQKWLTPKKIWARVHYVGQWSRKVSFSKGAQGMGY